MSLIVVLYYFIINSPFLSIQTRLFTADFQMTLYNDVTYKCHHFLLLAGKILLSILRMRYNAKVILVTCFYQIFIPVL